MPVQACIGIACYIITGEARILWAYWTNVIDLHIVSSVVSIYHQRSQSCQEVPFHTLAWMFALFTEFFLVSLKFSTYAGILERSFTWKPETLYKVMYCRNIYSTGTIVFVVHQILHTYSFPMEDVFWLLCQTATHCLRSSSDLMWRPGLDI
jgi:hypothetical protein